MNELVDFEMEVLDDVIGEQLPAHGLDTLTCLVHALRLHAHLDVLPDADVFDLAKPQRGQSLLDRDSLWIVDDWLGRHDDPRHNPYHSLRGLRGNSGLPTSRWYAVKYRSRVCATMSSGSRGGSDSLSHPERMSQSRTNCLSYDSGEVPT